MVLDKSHLILQREELPNFELFKPISTIHDVILNQSETNSKRYLTLLRLILENCEMLAFAVVALYSYTLRDKSWHSGDFC